MRIELFVACLSYALPLSLALSPGVALAHRANAQSPIETSGPSRPLKSVAAVDAHRQRWLNPWPATVGSMGRPAIDRAVMEGEDNGGLELAESLGAVPTAVASGSVATMEDRDFWSFESVGAFVGLEVVGRGTSPLTDSVLTLCNADGVAVARSDDAPGLGTLSRLALFVPAGTWFAVVDRKTATTGSGYELWLANTPTVPRACGSSGFAGMTGQDIMGIDVPHGGGRFEVTATSPRPGVDLGFVLWHPRGFLATFSDDDPRAAGTLHPGVTVGLVEGSYFLEVFHKTLVPGAFHEPFTASCRWVAPNVDLGTAGVAHATIDGLGSQHLFDLDLSGGARQVTLWTAPDFAGGVVPLADSVLTVGDAGMAAMVQVDDASPSDRQARVVMTLPAGRYTVVLQGFGLHQGASVVRLALEPPRTPGVPTGPGERMLPLGVQGEVSTSPWELCTPGSFRIATDRGNFGLLDVETGRAVGLLGNRLREPETVRLPAGRYQVYGYSIDGLANPEVGVLRIDGRLVCSGAVGQSTLLCRGKVGTLAALLASPVQASAPTTLPGLVGSLCVQTPALTLGIGAFGADGTIRWFSPCPGFGGSVPVQVVELLALPPVDPFARAVAPLNL